MTHITVFCGPALARDEVCGILDAEVHGPAAHGDLLGLHAKPGDVVLLLDVQLGDRPRLRHREILEVLRLGLRVIGGGGLGAVYAADLREHGMEGRGFVYRLYRDGALTAADEVARAHEGVSGGWRPTSDALCNIRASCRRYVRSCALAPSVAENVISAARATPYGERRLDNHLRQVLGSASVGHVKKLLDATSRRSDLLERDARMVLRSALDLQPRQRHRPPISLPPHCATEHWVHQYRAGAGRSVQVTDLEVLTFAQAMAADYPEFFRGVALESAGAATSPASSSSEPRLNLDAPLAQFLTEEAYDVDAWLDRRERAELDHDERIARLITRGFRLRPAIPYLDPVIARLKAQRGYPAIVAAASEAQHRLTRYAPGHLPSHVEALRWFTGRWGGAAMGVYDRGFTGPSEAGSRLVPLCYLDQRFDLYGSVSVIAGQGVFS